MLSHVQIILKCKKLILLKKEFNIKKWSVCQHELTSCAKLSSLLDIKTRFLYSYGTDESELIHQPHFHY